MKATLNRRQTALYVVKPALIVLVSVGLDLLLASSLMAVAQQADGVLGGLLRGLAYAAIGLGLIALLAFSGVAALLVNDRKLARATIVPTGLQAPPR